MKKLSKRRALKWLLGTTVLLSGCLSESTRMPSAPHDTRQSYHRPLGLEIEYPDVAKCPSPETNAAAISRPPLALEDPSQLPVWDLSLSEAVELAMGHSPVVRQIGGSVVQTGSNGSRTVFDPSLSYADPNLGVEAALSAFDAQYAGQLFWNKNDQPINQIVNPLFAAFQPTVFQQDTATAIAGVSKTTATGATFGLQHQVIYDNNNRPSRLFPGDFTGFVQAEYRQPLLQGAGVEFNRIAGPQTVPGVYRGVLIARLNNDVSLADFEASVIQLVSDVEQAYWNSTSPTATSTRLSAAVKPHYRRISSKKCDCESVRDAATKRLKRKASSSNSNRN